MSLTDYTTGRVLRLIIQCLCIIELDDCCLSDKLTTAQYAQFQLGVNLEPGYPLLNLAEDLRSPGKVKHAKEAR